MDVSRTTERQMTRGGPPEKSAFSFTDRSSWERVCLLLSRTLVLGSLCYGTWLNGATEPLTLLRISIALSAAVVLTVAAGLMGRRSAEPAVFLLLPLSAWILYAALQMAPVNFATRTFFQGPVGLQDEFVRPGLAELSIDDSSIIDPSVFAYLPIGTVSYDQTRRAIVPFLMTFAFIYLSTRLFQSSRSRRILLWYVVANCTWLAAWGILQRAGGSVELLPGVRNAYSSPPFASFIYKNAGAAAILPGAAAAMLLFALSRSGSPSRSVYQSRQSMLSRRHVGLLICLSVMSIAICVSLSRGAWISAIISLLIVVAIRRRGYLRLMKYASIAVAVVAVGLVAASFVAQRLSDSLQKRIGDLSFDGLSKDQRWSHWTDGLKAAKANFPSGTGLGTYGYATLPYEEQVHLYWFREAHNQYLEIATESGLVGITVLIFMISWFVRCCLIGMRDQKHPSSLEWASFGIALALLAGIQSAVDFVIMMPTNLFLYAILMSVVAVRIRKDQQPNIIESRSERRSLSWFAPIPGIVVVSICLVGSIHINRQRANASVSIDETSKSLPEESNRSELSQQMLRRVDQGIAASPTSAELWELRAAWQLIAYRAELFNELSRIGQNVTWEATNPININEFLASMSLKDWTKTRSELASTPTLRHFLAQIRADSAMSLKLNGLQTNTYHRSMLIARMTGMDLDFWHDKSARLSNNDAKKLFYNGIISYLHHDDQRMIDQWSRALTYSDRFRKEIVFLSLRRLPALQIAKQIVPPDRPEMMVDLAVPIKTADQLNALDLKNDSFDPAVARQLMAYCETASRFDEVSRFSTLAQFCEKLGDFDGAVLYWDKSLHLSPQNSHFRSQLIEALIALERYDEALNQAILGRSLHPSNFRYRELIARARRGVVQQR